MGGIGSGRPASYQPTVESVRTIDIRYMRQAKLLVPGRLGRMNWSRNGDIIGSINYQVTSDRLILSFKYRSRFSDEPWQDSEQLIRLASTPCYFGGVRQWLVCPRCERRCTTLHMGRVLFLCRQCLNLGYQSQLEGKHGRACLKRDKLADQLYGKNRRRMWRRTRDKLIDRYCEASEQADRELIAAFEAMRSFKPIISPPLVEG